MTQLFGNAAAKLCNAAALLLGWRPNEFWDATPAEVWTALRPPTGSVDAPDRSTIEELQRRFPDET